MRIQTPLLPQTAPIFVIIPVILVNGIMKDKIQVIEEIIIILMDMLLLL